MKPTILLLLLALSVVAQVPPPQVPLTGNIGPQGIFPLLNHGTIPITGNYTMTYPDMSAEVIRFTGTLSATATITAPPTFGFDFLVENSTTGGQSIYFVGPSGKGVTIPNGQAMQVMSDGINYVSVGGGGFGTVVTAPPIQNVVGAVAGGASTPVVIPPNYTGTDHFNNPSGVRVYDYRQKFGVDSRFFRDAKEWGVKSDGKIAYCTATAGSPVLNCFSGFVPAAADVGKVAVARGYIGASTGRLYGWSVVSGGSGGTDGVQPVTFTGLSGCTSTFNQPIVYVHVVGGVPQPGAVIQDPGGYGIGCTGTPPTQGTVATVTGTVTFSGGAFIYGDLPTSIVAVNGAQVTMADNAQESSSNVALIYGTDDNDGTNNNWNAACNGMIADVYAFGHLTFSGISLITHGITCSGAMLKIEGSGWTPYPAQGGATILYAGKTTGDHVIQMGGGDGAELDRFRIDGNSQALPIGLLLVQGSGGGNLPNAYGWFHNIWFGSMYGDGISGNYAVVPQLQNCVYAKSGTGNNDFNVFDRIQCMGVKTATDSDNNQAVNWAFGKWQSQYDEIGFTCWGQMQIKDYYTETNRLDIMNGSPTTTTAYPGMCHFEQYGGESSAEHIAQSPYYLAGSIIVDNGYGLSESGCSTNGACLQANRVSVDVGAWYGQKFFYHGGLPGSIVRNGGCAPSQQQWEVETEPDKIYYTGGYGPTCNNLFAQRQTLNLPDVGAIGQANIDISVLSSLQDPSMQGVLQEHDNIYSKFIGSVDVMSPTPPGTTNVPSTPLDWATIKNEGTAGSTTFNYQISCLDGAGRETNATTLTTTTSAATLTPPPSGNWNRIIFWNHVGCPKFNLYSDEGSGQIGWLNTFRAIDLQGDGSMYFGNIYIDDYGQYTKNTSRTPPAISQTGILNVQNGFQVNGLPLSTFHLHDWLSTDASQFSGDVPESNGSVYKSSFLFPNQTGIPGVTAGGGSVQAGYTTTATGGDTALQPGSIYCRPVTITQNMLVTDMVTNWAEAGTGYTLIHAIYKANGQPLAGFPYNQPGTKACQASQAMVAGDNEVGFSPACKLSQGQTYHMCFQTYDLTGTGGFVGMKFDTPGGPPPPTMSCGSAGNHGGTMPNDLSKDPNLGCGTTIPVGQWPKLYVEGTLQPTLNANNFTATNPVPAAFLGTGSTGSGTNVLRDNQTWGPVPGGSGGNVSWANVTSATNTGQGLRVGTGSNLSPDLTAGVVIANVLGGSGPGGGVATGNAYVLPQTFVTGGYLQFTGTGFAWNVPAGSGGGSTAWSSLTAPTQDLSVNLGNWRTVFTPNFAGDNSGGTAYAIQQLGTPGTGTNYTLFSSTSSASNVSPANFTNSQGNGLRIDGASQGNAIRAMGASKFLGPVQLTGGLNNLASLATDNTGNIIAGTGGGAAAYAQTFQNVAMIASPGPIPLSGCTIVNNNCVAITPTADTSYRLLVTVTQTQPGQNCSANGSLQFWVSYTDPDGLPSGTIINNAAVAAGNLGAGSYTQNMNMGNPANGSQNIFNVQPVTIRIMHGTSFSYRIQQSVVASNCAPQPTFTMRVALFGEPGITATN